MNKHYASMILLVAFGGACARETIDGGENSENSENSECTSGGTSVGDALADESKIVPVDGGQDVDVASVPDAGSTGSINP